MLYRGTQSIQTVILQVCGNMVCFARWGRKHEREGRDQARDGDFRAGRTFCVLYWKPAAEQVFSFVFQGERGFQSL